MSMNHLGSILRNYSPQSPLRKSVTSAMVVEYANNTLASMFGPGVAEFAQAVVFKDGVLVIRATSSSASGSIQGRYVELIDKLNESIGSNLVRSIRYGV